MAVGESTRFGTMSQYANFASSLPMSGEGTVIILMPFLLKENRRHGPVRLMANGQQLVWRICPNCAFALQGARKIDNIQASSGVIWGITAEPIALVKGETPCANCFIIT